MNREKLCLTVRHVASLLEKEAYEELESLSQGVRLSAEEMKEAIRSYGRKITCFPEAACKELDIVEVLGSIPKQWRINVPLFTESEDHSDLTLSVTLIESETALHKIEVDDIHVL